MKIWSSIKLMYYFFLIIILSACHGESGGLPSQADYIPDTNNSYDLSSIRLDIDNSINMFEGEVQPIEVKVVNEENIFKTISESDFVMESNNSAVAYIEGNHIVAASEGQASIAVSYEGLSTEVTVNVEAISIVKVETIPNDISIPKGASRKIKVFAYYSNGTKKDITHEVSISSGNGILISITNDGFITAQSSGVTDINITYGGVSTATPIQISDAILMEIHISPDSLFLPEGVESKLEVIGIFSDGTLYDLTDSVDLVSSDTNIVSVNGDSEVYAKSVGTAQVTATLGVVSQSLTVNVSSAVLEELTIDPMIKRLPAGASVQLVATGFYSNGTSYDLTPLVEWTSSNTDVLNVVEGSILESYQLGESKITATFSGKSEFIDISVYDDELVSLSLSPSESEIIVGTTQTFSVKGTYSNGDIQDLTDESSFYIEGDNAIFLEHNRIKALNSGNIEVTVRYSGLEETAQLNIVEDSVQQIDVISDSNSIAAGVSQQLSAEATLNSGKVQDLSDEVIWSSSDTSIASVNSSGLLNTKTSGNVLIEASYQDVTGSENFTVTTALLESIDIESDATEVALGYSLMLTAMGVFSDSTELDIQENVFWTVDDSGNASINQSGELFTHNVGVVEVTVFSGNISSSMSINITEPVITHVKLEADGEGNRIVLLSNNIAEIDAIAYYSDGSSRYLDDEEIQWSLNGDSFLSVGYSGLITLNAVVIGSVDITASAYSKLSTNKIAIGCLISVIGISALCDVSDENN